MTFAAVLVLVAAWAAAAPDEDYVGSAVCAGCHSPIARRFATHPMARGSGALQGSLAGLALPGRVQHAPSGFRYTVSAGPEGRLVLEYEGPPSEPATTGRVELEHFVGGSKGYGFLYARDGYLYEAPVSYYLDERAWRVSPGFESEAFVRLARPAQVACVECHFSGARPAAGTANRFALEPYREGGVACERCHGPGRAHRERILRGGSGDLAIVHPAKLPPDRRDAICAQCHLQGAARVQERGCGLETFRPGQALDDVATHFVWAGETGPLDQTSHYEKLWRSACHRSSRGQLWCASCHDPHQSVAAAESAHYYRERCLSCHLTRGCTLPRDRRAEREDDCIACHMPRRGNEKVPHAVTTDHSIPRLGDRPVPTSSPGLRDLVPFWGGTASARDLGLAYASLGRDREAYRERAKALLRGAYGDGARDAQTLILLATFLEGEGTPQKALPLYQEALAGDGGCADELAVAENRLGALRASAGGFDAARALFEKALLRIPVYEAARVNLARARARLGDVAGARRILQEGLILEPGSPALVEARVALPPPASPSPR